MSINIATLARNNAGTAVTDLIDAGSINAAGKIEIRTGSKPATPQIAATGTLLATFTMSLPSFGSFVNGVASANAIANAQVVTDGLAGWYRVYDRDNQAVLDGDISDVTGSGDLIFDDVNFREGGLAVISNLTLTMPQ